MFVVREPALSVDDGEICHPPLGDFFCSMVFIQDGDYGGSEDARYTWENFFRRAL